MKLETLLAKLADGAITPLPRRQWEALADEFQAVDRRPTGCAGEIVLLKRGRQWAVLEYPGPDEVVLRPFKTRKQAQGFIDERIAAYDRIWDG